MTSVSSRPNRPLHKTCDQCRSRKVRCDGKFGICSNCDRLGFSCSFKQPSLNISGNSDLAPANPQRCRVRKACVSCHSLKARCNGQSPTCQRCHGKGIQCVYVPSKRAASESALKASSPHRGPDHRPAVSQVSGGSSVTLDLDQLGRSSPDQVFSGHTRPQLNAGPTIPHRDMMIKALESHFKYIHPLPKYAFLHKTSLFQEYDAGETEESLLLAIIGNTTQVKSSSSEEREYGLKCIDQAAALALRNVGRPSISKLQALVLILRYRSATQCFSDAFMLLATIARSAFALRLNYESPKLCFLAQELRRRLMWTIYMLDTVWSAGLQEFTICPANVIHLQLPCHERDFELGVQRVTAQLIGDFKQDTELSLLAYYIRMMTIRDHILRYTKHAASTPTSNVSEAVKSLEAELQNFLLSLPESVKFSEENLRLRAFSPWLPRFVMLHIWYHQCHCDLYRLLIPGLRESLPKTTLQQIDRDFVIYCQIRCVANSRALSGILRAMLSLEIETPVMDTDISVCAYQATRIVFHAYHVDAVRFSLTMAFVTDVADVCRLLLSKLAHTSSMVSSIQADIEDLIAYGFSPRSSSRSSSPDQEDHIPSAAQGASSKQILSRHSLVKKSAFVESDIRVTSTSRSQQLQQKSLLTNSNTSTSPGAPLISSQPRIASMHTIDITTQHFVNAVPSFGGSNTESLAQMGWETNVSYENAWDQFSWRLEPDSQVQNDWAEFNLEPDYWNQVQPE